MFGRLGEFAWFGGLGVFCIWFGLIFCDFVMFCFFPPALKCRRLAEALEIDDNSDPFNIRSSGPKYSDLLKEDARYDRCHKYVNNVESNM